MTMMIAVACVFESLSVITIGVKYLHFHQQASFFGDHGYCIMVSALAIVLLLQLLWGWRRLICRLHAQKELVGRFTSDEEQEEPSVVTTEDLSTRGEQDTNDDENVKAKLSSSFLRILGHSLCKTACRFGISSALLFCLLMVSSDYYNLVPMSLRAVGLLLFFLLCGGWFLPLKQQQQMRQHPSANTKDPIFGWPFFFSSDSISSHVTMISVGFLEAVGLPRAANAMFFASCYDFYTGRLFSHLEHSTIQGGPVTKLTSKDDATATLSPESLQEHLQAFNKLNTEEEWWWSKNVTLCNVLINNEEALTERLKLIEQATCSIWMVTWLIEDSPTGRMLANALIRRAQEGLDVRIMVDAATLYYLHQKVKRRGMNDLGTLYHNLIKGGVLVRMLDDIHDEVEPAFVIGNHRKILLVDHHWMITGGRNNSNRYFTTTNYHYHDADITLEGDFSNSTGALYDKLWNDKARDIGPLMDDLTKMTACNLLESDTKKTEELHIAKSFDHLEVNGDKDASVSVSSTTSIDTSKISFDFSSDDSLENSDDDDLLEDEGGGELVLPDAAAAPSPAAPLLPSKMDQQCQQPTTSTGHPISLFQLDHKAGNTDGYDIILSTLLFLVDTAQERIDLVLGYFQLFPVLEEAMKRAVCERGVKIRLVTNSSASNGLPGFNGIFGKALARILELDNVQVYVKADEHKDDGAFCFHYKVGLFDRKAAVVGSWNCIASSVFYNSEFSVVMFDNCKNKQHAFQEFEELIDESIRVGRVVPMKEVRKMDFKIPFYFWLLSSTSGKRQMNRGY